MKRRIQTIQSQIFLHYALLITALILAVAGGDYLYTSSVLRSIAHASLRETALRISEGIDAEFRNMNDSSIRVAYSGLVRERFTAYLEADTPSEDFSTKRMLLDIFTAIMGPMFPVHQINLYDPGGAYVGAGYDNGSGRKTPGSLPWLTDTIAAQGRKVLSPPPYPKNRFGNEVISLTRIFYDEFNQEVGYIEVQQEARYFFRHAMDEESGARIFVFDGRKRLLFPEKGEGFQEVLDGTPADGADLIVTKKEVIALHRSVESGLTVLAAMDQNRLLRPLMRMTRIVAALSLLGLLAALGVSFLLAGRITRPITRLRQEAAGMNMTRLLGRTAKLDSAGRGFDELVELQRTFRDMHRRLRRSVDERLALTARETEARMLALQARMSPHFLYNTISNISILAEEGRPDSVVRSCALLTAMLRYITAGETSRSTIGEEADYARRYLELMELRFQHKIRFHIDIPRNMTGLPCGRLLIQPLAENAVKHSYHHDPPWEVDIRGWTTHGGWRIEVADRGPGFEAGFGEAFARRIRSEEFLLRAPTLEVGGMGLANIAARLILEYGEASRIETGNRPGGGAVVRIGIEADS